MMRKKEHRTPFMLHVVTLLTLLEIYKQLINEETKRRIKSEKINYHYTT